MKYKRRDDLVRGLYELAHFVDEHGLEIPDFDVTVSQYISSYTPDYMATISEADRKRTLKRIVRLLPKPVKKEYLGNTFQATHRFGDCVPFTISVSREVACKAVPTGKKIHHEAQLIKEWDEDEVEWVCTDPILKETV